MNQFYDSIKGFSTRRLLRLRDAYRKMDQRSKDIEEMLVAIRKELRLRTKRRYGKAV